MDIRQKFLPRILVKFTGIISSPKNDCNFRLPNLVNDISNRSYRSIESKEVKKLWSKVMNSLESKFFLSILLFWDALYNIPKAYLFTQENIKHIPN